MSEARVFTAQVRDSDNVVQAVTATSFPLIAPPGMLFIVLEVYHPEYSGWIYHPADGTFTAPSP